MNQKPKGISNSRTLPKGIAKKEEILPELLSITRSNI